VRAFRDEAEALAKASEDVVPPHNAVAALYLSRRSLGEGG
jgi:hypothetical protein